MVEGFLSHLTLRFGLEDLVDGRTQDSVRWLEYFAALCPAADDNLFYQYQNVAANAEERQQIQKDLATLETGKREGWVMRTGLDSGQFVSEIVRATKWFSIGGHGLHFVKIMALLEQLEETANLLNPGPKPGETAIQTTT